MQDTYSYAEISKTHSSSIDDSSLKHTASHPYSLDKQTTFIQESPKKIPPSKLDSYAEQIRHPNVYVYSQNKYAPIQDTKININLPT